MPVDESEQDRSKRQTIVREADEELADLAIEAEFDRIQRYSDDSLAAQVKQNPDTHLDRIGFKACKEGQAVEERLDAVGRALISACCWSVLNPWQNGVLYTDSVSFLEWRRCLPDVKFVMKQQVFSTLHTDAHH